MAVYATVNKQKQLVFVVQGLRGYLVAQKGRNMAGFALIKSAAYSYFFDEASKMSRQTATALVFKAFLLRFAQSARRRAVLALGFSQVIDNKEKKRK